MLRASKTVAPVAVVILLGSLMMAPVPAQDQPEQGATAIQPVAGYVQYKGLTSKGKVALTQTAPTTFGETGTWVTLPNSNLTWTVPAGNADLFNVAFSAECRLFNGGGDDYLRIRIVDSLGGPLEPDDGQQAFCSADGYATYKGNWVKKANPGNHALVVQFWIEDGPPAEVVTASIDDWTFELVVYD